MVDTYHQSFSDAEHQKLYQTQKGNIKLNKSGTTENISVYKSDVREKEHEFIPGRWRDSPRVQACNIVVQIVRIVRLQAHSCHIFKKAIPKNKSAAQAAPIRHH